MVPQLDLLRRHLRRHPGRVRGLFRQAGKRTHARRGGADGRYPAVALALQPAGESHRRAHPPARRAGPDGAARLDHPRRGQCSPRRATRLQGQPLRHRGAALRARPHRRGDHVAVRGTGPLRRRPRGDHDPRSRPAARGAAHPGTPHLGRGGGCRGPQRGVLRPRYAHGADPRLRREPRLLPRGHRGPQRQRGRGELAGIDAEAVHLHVRVHAGLEHGHGHPRHPRQGDRPGDRRVLRADQPGRPLRRHDQRGGRPRQLAQHSGVQDDSLRPASATPPR